MTNEEAAKRLETRVHWDIEFICCDQEDFTENLDAIEMGAAALREIEGLRKQNHKLKRKLEALREHIAFDVEMREGAKNRPEGK